MNTAVTKLEDLSIELWLELFIFFTYTQVVSMSPEPTGHAKYPICSCEGS